MIFLFSTVYRRRVAAALAWLSNPETNPPFSRFLVARRPLDHQHAVAAAVLATGQTNSGGIRPPASNLRAIPGGVGDGINLVPVQGCQDRQTPDHLRGKVFAGLMDRV